ncbi:alpha/beta hydrolase fold domain-containing protein [Pseudoduganella sp. FT93W]|uniref:Alpha/beta hydrolase fold domain-containing protein n=1 Tax=Duganella fentianensis TaxID=2692177 RepID=A0A845HVF1_9BURK|nr:alpha/beta hydrolase [Duganella fentianensis]MYN45404.1 alpha/beta hydrolase fold domain-containing protein [Duganella fentianensis]
MVLAGWHRAIWRLNFVWLAGLAGVASATPSAPACVLPAADPDNTYDAAHTYAKLHKDYPFIRIASADLPENVRRLDSLTYVQYGSRCLQLDLFLPSKAGPHPLVVLVHGGGWRSGFRAEFAPMAVRLAQQGWAAATISYRLSGEAGYPAAIHDVRAAVRWLRSHAADYQLDGQRFALAGGSAGGQIASLAGVTGHLPAFDAGAADSEVSSAVQAIVNIDGLSDFTAPAALQYEDDPAKQPSAAGAWLGGRYAEQPARWRAASPVQYVRAGMPPILFIGSSKARFSVGREDMMARMQQVGVASAMLVLPETPHSFWMFDPWLQPTVDATIAFLKQQLPER